MPFETILARVERYYTATLRKHGPTAKGVDWNSAESQTLRFEQIVKVCDPSRRFSINDYGCGCGALADHLRRAQVSCDYRGYDILPGMIAAAADGHRGWADCVFTSDPAGPGRADYTVASGVFNVKLDTRDEDWSAYADAELDRIAALSTRGFAFNMLTAHVTSSREDRLYYADPAHVFERCRTRFSRHVALLHDYPLYEFTILVRL